jgi:glycogen operon protein
MTADDWAAADQRSIMFFLNGQMIPTPDARGQQILDDSFLVLLNGAADQLKFTLPGEAYGRLWEIMVYTADPDRRGSAHQVRATERIVLGARSIQILLRMDDARER